MLGLPSFLFSDEQLEKMEQRRRESAERRIQQLGAEPWTDDIKWKQELVIQAPTFKPRRLFNVVPLESNDVRKGTKRHLAVSPCGQWSYVEKVVPRAVELATIYGGKRGTVMFDGDVVVPSLHQRDELGRWNPETWMSITPMEMISLRAGTRRARGNVIIAGLGLGHQLIDVSHRTQVKHLVLVEKDEKLVNWLLPKIKKHMGRRLDGVVIGDAYKVMPNMTADVALVDIFSSHGSNEWRRKQLVESCFGINYIWAWGA